MAKTIEITKPVTIEIDGNTYTLEFNRNSVVAAEKAGFRADLIGDMPNTMLPLLFYAAFKMHQPKNTPKETDDILERIGGLNAALVNRLSELYAIPTQALIRTDDYDDGTEKNFKISL